MSRKAVPGEGTVRGTRGFTLIEVLVSLAIISGALITIIYTVNQHLNLIRRHEVITIGTILGREKLLGMTTRETEKTGTFPEPFQDYSYEVSIEDSQLEGTRRIKLFVINGDERVYLMKFSGTGPL